VTTRDENRPAQLSTRIAFLIAGIGFSTLAPLIPGIKAHLHLDDSTLGLLLLCVGLGSIVVMPFAGGFSAKFGCRNVIVVSALGLCLSLPLIAFAPSIPFLVGGLLLMGAGGGTLDVVMNIQAVVVEQESNRPMMSGFHGMFSVGGILGAGGLTALLSLRVSPVVGQAIIAGACALMLGVVTPKLLARIAPGEATKPKTFSLPRGKVLLLGILCLIVFMGEGSVTDWSGVLLNDFRHVDLNFAGMGYVAFAAMMTLNRLTGDIVVAKLGRRAVMLGGSSCAAIGFALAALVPNWLTSVLGFAMVGIGLANVVPILFTATGNQDDMPANLALSSVTTMGYIGLLAGPPMLGFIAHKTSLLISLGFLSLLCIVVAICTRFVTESSSNQA
jgi:MFS family permease